MTFDPRKVTFGVHSLTPYDRDTKIPYGMALIVQNGTFAIESEQVDLYGGSLSIPWASEDGDATATLQFSVSEYPAWIYELFAGATVTEGSGEANGFVGNLANFNGTSMVAAAGIASVAALPGSTANLKGSIYILEATGADDFVLKVMSNADFSRGASATISEGNIVATISGATSGQVIDLTTLGLRITMGASSPALTIGDTATFEVRPVNSFNMDVLIGESEAFAPEFGAFLYGQKRGDGSIFEIEVFKLKASGITLGAERKQFGTTEYSAKASYDPVRNGLARVRKFR